MKEWINNSASLEKIGRDWGRFWKREWTKGWRGKNRISSNNKALLSKMRLMIDGWIDLIYWRRRRRREKKFPYYLHGCVISQSIHFAAWLTFLWQFNLSFLAINRGSCLNSKVTGKKRWQMLVCWTFALLPKNEAGAAILKQGEMKANKSWIGSKIFHDTSHKFPIFSLSISWPTSLLKSLFVKEPPTLRPSRLFNPH